MAEFIKRNVKTRNKTILYNVENSRIIPSVQFANALKRGLKGSSLSTYDKDQAYVFEKIPFKSSFKTLTNQRKNELINLGSKTLDDLIKKEKVIESYHEFLKKLD